MARQDRDILAFNRGVVSALGLARIDLERMAMSAEVQSNFVPRVLGSMMLRPGFEFIDRPLNDNLFGRELPFTFGVDDTALIEVTPQNLRVRIDDVLITRPTVTAAVTNGNFTSDISGWTDDDEAGAVSSWQVLGYAQLIGTGENAAILTQEVTVNEADTEHALRIVVNTGDMRLRVGSTDGDDDYVTETFLDVGEHSISFTPSGNFWVQIANVEEYKVWVDSITVESAGEMAIATPWSEADLPFLRWDQSGDVIYVACKNANTTGHTTNAERPMKIERRGDGRSWSVVRYLPSDGPFRTQNTGPTTLAPSAISGEITLTASKPLFKSTHATWNSLFRVASQGQTVSESISAEDTFTSPIRVVGSDSARSFGIIVEGTFSATVTLQFAFSENGPWNDQGASYTVPTSTNYDDGQDGQIIYYRIGVKAGDYTSGTVTATLTYTGGSIQGICRINTVTNSTTATASVLKDFGSLVASSDWWEGEWSARRGYPTSVQLHEGRLWWAGFDKIWGSIVDSFESFDDNFEGDAGSISRTIGVGARRVVHWLISLGRLMIGTSDNSANIASARMDGNNPLGARSNSFDEPLTPTNFNIKTISSKGVFVDRTKQRLYELLYDIDQQDYKSQDLSVFAPDFNQIGIKQISVQMKPDIRIHCVREDGTVGMLVYDRLENVICWLTIDSTGADGEIEDVAVLPGTVEDQVYYTIKRTINGSTQRHLCKWAMESEAIGGDLNKMGDSFAAYDGAATTTPFTTELLHLRGEQVVVWADGSDVGLHTVSSAGSITLTTAASKVVAGLYYRSRFKSAKLADIQGVGLLERKKVNRIGFIAKYLHYQGLQYGPDFDNLYDMPKFEEGQSQSADTVHETYHEDDFPFGGEWDADSRVCLQAEAPKPCTLLATVFQMETVEKMQRQT